MIKEHLKPTGRVFLVALEEVKVVCAILKEYDTSYTYADSFTLRELKELLETIELPKFFASFWILCI